MRAVLRRTSGPRHARLTVRDLEIDLAARIVTVGGEPVQLSAKEYELLVALAEDPERVFKKEDLLCPHGVESAEVTAKDDIATVARQLAALTQTVEEMAGQLKEVREHADSERERTDVQQERIDLAARELSDVSDRLQAAANALRESI
jgi:hypothetical protein